MKVMSGVLTTRIKEGNDTVKIINNKSFGSTQLDLSYDVIENVDKSTLDKYMLKKNDVIIMCVEPFKVGFINEDGVLATNALLKITSNLLTSKEVYKLLNTQKFRRHIQNSTEGTNIKRLSARHINDFVYDESDYKNADLYYELHELISIRNKELDNIKKMAKILCQ